MEGLVLNHFLCFSRLILVTPTALNAATTFSFWWHFCSLVILQTSISIMAMGFFQHRIKLKLSIFVILVANLAVHRIPRVLLARCWVTTIFHLLHLIIEAEQLKAIDCWLRLWSCLICICIGLLLTVFQSCSCCICPRCSIELLWSGSKGRWLEDLRLLVYYWLTFCLSMS